MLPLLTETRVQEIFLFSLCYEKQHQHDGKWQLILVHSEEATGKGGQGWV